MYTLKSVANTSMDENTVFNYFYSKSLAAFTVNFFALRCVALRAATENTPTSPKVASFHLYELNVFITHRIIVYDEITRERRISMCGIRPL